MNSQNLLTHEQWAGLVCGSLIISAQKKDLELDSKTQRVDISSMEWNQKDCESLFREIRTSNPDYLEFVIGSIMLNYRKHVTPAAILFTAKDIEKSFPENHPAVGVKACIASFLEKNPQIYSVLDYAMDLKKQSSHADDWATIMATAAMSADQNGTRQIHADQLDILHDPQQFVPFAQTIREEMNYYHFKKVLEMRTIADSVLEGRTLKIKPFASKEKTFSSFAPSSSKIIH